MNQYVPSESIDRPAVTDDDNRPSSRELEVLAAVLDLMVEEGDGFSMAAVARRARCSKETLYRWYGDRVGLLTATVRWQASKVMMPRLEDRAVTLSTFRKTLEAFAASWLGVLTGDVSIALNRLAVSHGGNGGAGLGHIVLENGPLAMRARLIPIFNAGRKHGLISTTNDAAFRLFFGLVVADAQIRCLLGEASRPGTKEIRDFSETAVAQFLELCGHSNEFSLIEHTDKE